MFEYAIQFVLARVNFSCLTCWNRFQVAVVRGIQILYHLVPRNHLYASLLHLHEPEDLLTSALGAMGNRIPDHDRYSWNFLPRPRDSTTLLPRPAVFRELLQR